MYVCAATNHLPTDPLVRSMTTLQAEAMEFALHKLEDARWRRIEKILGTFWEYADVNPMTHDAQGKPLPKQSGARDMSVMRAPLACIIRPGLFNEIKKVLRPPQEMLSAMEDANREAGIIDMADLPRSKFMEEFSSALSNASNKVREADDKELLNKPQTPQR